MINSLVLDAVLPCIKSGDTVEIVPIDKFPNAERRFMVNDKLEEGFLYGLSETCDGYVMPYSWIKEIKIVG